MADTTTPNLGLLLADLTDTFRFDAHVEANLSIIDAYMGAVKCTSITRPTTTYGGQLIYETDTHRLAENSGTSGSPVWTYVSSAIVTCTSTTRPTLGLVAGLMIYETNTGLIRVYTGSAWVDSAMANCTSTTRPANPIAGDLAYETDTNAVVIWNGSAWVYRTVVACTSGARPTTALAAGVTAYETDTHRQIVWTGSAWQQVNMVVCTSSTHPANPLAGGLIFETDTGMEAVYTGTAYLYGPQQIGTVILTGPAGNMTISNIPACNHLLIVYTGRQDSGSGGAYTSLQMNGDTASHYTYQNIVGNVSTASSMNAGALAAGIRMGPVPGSGDTASYFGTGTITIGNIQSATAFKPAACSYSAAVSPSNGYSGTTGGLWASTAAVTSLKLLPSSGNFVAGSSMTAYALM